MEGRVAAAAHFGCCVLCVVCCVLCVVCCGCDEPF